jgi:hypothetical protein
LHGWVCLEVRNGGEARCVIHFLHADALVELLTAIRQLSQLQRLELSLQKPEAAVMDSSEELTDVLIQSVTQLICLQFLLLGNIPFVAAEEPRRVIRCAWHCVIFVVQHVGCSGMQSLSGCGENISIPYKTERF